MEKTFKVVLFIESSRASGRDLLRGVARYAHNHGPWSFYWEPGGLETSRPTLKTLDADGIIFRDVGRLRGAGSAAWHSSGGPRHREREVRRANECGDGFANGWPAGGGTLDPLRIQALCFLWPDQHPPGAGAVVKSALRMVPPTSGRAGWAQPPSLVLRSSGLDWQQNRRRLADWLVKLPHPLGILACNDDCGAQVTAACKLAGLAVPDRAGVVGVDNDEVICGLSDPPMTSIALNFEQAGYDAAQALENAMRKVKSTPFLIKVLATHLVARRSTDVVAVDDPHLAKALGFIRDHARASFSVNDVARQSGVSRRVLEGKLPPDHRQFNPAPYPRDPNGEIARLLVETNWPVSKIAETLGYGDVQHFARYFQSGKKTTPLAFRKNHGSLPV